MLDVNMNTVYSLANNMFLYRIKELDKYWVFNIESGEHYTLNETSFWILEQIDGTEPLKVVYEKFLKAFEVDEKQGEKDFFEIIEGFSNEGIIREGG